MIRPGYGDWWICEDRSESRYSGMPVWVEVRRPHQIGDGAFAILCRRSLASVCVNYVLLMLEWMESKTRNYAPAIVLRNDLHI